MNVISPLLTVPLKVKGKTVYPTTLELFKKLMLLPELQDFDSKALSVEDIIAMKLSAVAGRGSKKDFFDIFYLLKSYELEQMLSFFEKRFPDTNKFHILSRILKQ